jgi:quercetin dioxygenase-like cupin family protein
VTARSRRRHAPPATATTRGATPSTRHRGEEQVGINDRLFLTAAVRTDQNSAFGTSFQRVFYPKASASWIVSDEGFFPKQSWLDQLRFRSSYGASGVQPGSNDALRSFEGRTINVRGVDRVTIRAGSDLPEHAHPHEQIMIVLSGDLELVVGGEPQRLRDGDVHVIPGGVVHSAHAHAECEVIDVFHPVREDYR